MLLMWAVVVGVLGIAHVIGASPRSEPRPVAVPATTAPRPAAAPSSTVVVFGSPPPTVSPSAGAGAGSRPAPSESPSGSATAPEAAPSPPVAAGNVSAPALAVSCHPDVSLAASPDAPYSFLCLRGTTPISWPSDSIRLFTAGLTPQQTAALPVALAQWQQQARFTVTRVDSAAAANVVMIGATLTSNEDGYTSMHYVCAANCAFDHADVRLASNVTLTKTSWVATILHELGHVAGLNHVARHSEVMYPEIDAESPVTYGSGDLAGLQALEKVRPAA